MKIFKNNKKGSLMVEILVVVFIIGIVLVSLLGFVTVSFKTQTSIKKNYIATNLAQEGIEAVRSFRDGTSWSSNGLGTLTVGTDYDYYPKKSSANPPAWTLVSGKETINEFERKIIFSNVMRDANGNILASGGTNDPDTKKVTVTISWPEKSVEIIVYLTNWKQ